MRTYEFGRRFVAAGHAVDVLCCAAYDPTLAGQAVVDVAGMRVHVSRTRYRAQMGFWVRVGSFLAFAAFAAAHILRHGKKYDLIIASSGPLSMALPALLACWIHKTPFVFEVIDVWPDAAIEAGVLRNPLLCKLAWRLEACAYRHARQIVTCSTGMTARIVRKGVDAERLTTISNSCDLEVFQPDAARRAAARTALGLRDDQLVVLYAGAMGRSNAMDDIVQTAKLVADDPRIVWWFAGDGVDAEKLRQVGGHIWGTLPREKMAALYRSADVALVTFLHAPLFDENSPNKFFDAMAAGLPVIFNRSTWLEPDITSYGCGFVCKAQPAPAMAARLQELASDPSLRQRMGAGARRLAEERFSRDKLAERYLNVLGRRELPAKHAKYAKGEAL